MGYTNPFGIQKSAEEIFNPEEIYKLFANPPDYQKCLEPNNHVIIGSMGCGKTTLLKSLSLPVMIEKKELNEMNFMGVYVSLQKFEIRHFVQIYEYTENSDIFEHFFSIMFIHEFLKQIKQAQLPNIIQQKIANFVFNEFELNSFKSIEPIIEKLHSLRKKIREDVSTRHDLDRTSFNYVKKSFNIDKLISFLETLNDNILKKERLPKICLLIDGYDYLGDLKNILNPFLEKENLSFMCTKIATRVFCDIADIEYKRDFEIICLDHNPDDPEYRNMVKLTANKRMIENWKLKEDEIDIETVFSSLVPSDIDSVWDTSLSLGKNLYLLHQKEASKKRNRRQMAYFGFDCFVKLSSGNILTFLELCDLAFRKEQEKKGIFTKIPIISSKSQTEAAVEYAREIFDYKIESSPNVALYFEELGSFIYWASRECEEKSLREPSSYEGVRIEVYAADLPKHILRLGILDRFLICSREEITKINLSLTYLPKILEINRSITPYFGISWQCKGKLTFPPERVESFMKKPRPGDPDEDFKRRKTHQEKIVKGRYVFISTPYSPESEKRIKKVRNTLKYLRSDAIKLRGDRLEELEDREISQDVWMLSKRHVGTYTRYIPTAISNSLYVVHDITVPKTYKNISTGVAYEMGLSIGFKIPYLLFWDEFLGPFRKNVLPKIVRQVNVYRWNRAEKKRKSFRRWFTEIDNLYSNIKHEKVKCPFSDYVKEENDCKYKNKKIRSTNSIFISFQSRNKSFEDLLIEKLHSWGKQEITRGDLSEEGDEACFTCWAIQKADACLIDGSSGAPLYALQLGMAHSLKKPTLMFYNLKQGNDPINMYMGLKQQWRDSTTDRGIEIGLKELSIFKEYKTEEEL